MSSASVETQLALLAQAQKEQEEHLKRTDTALAEAEVLILALQAERTKALVWGIATLGTAVLVMAGWIANFIATHIGPLK